MTMKGTEGGDVSEENTQDEWQEKTKMKETHQNKMATMMKKYNTRKIHITKHMKPRG